MIKKINRIMFALTVSFICYSILSTAYHLIHWDNNMEEFAERYSEMMAAEPELARTYFSYFFSKDYIAIRSAMDPEFIKKVSEQDLQKIADTYFSQKPLNLVMVGTKIFESPDVWRGSYTLQYQLPDKWLLAAATFRKKTEAPAKVIGMTVQPLPKPLEELHKFSLGGKQFKHYVFLFLAVAIPCLIISTLFLCLLSPVQNKKWLWLLFIFMGFVRFSLDWSSGAVGFVPVSFQLLGSGFTVASPYAPVIVMFSIPIGAIVFLFKRKYLIANPPAENLPMQDTDISIDILHTREATPEDTLPKAAEQLPVIPRPLFSADMYMCDECDFQIRKDEYDADQLFCPNCGNLLSDTAD